MHTPQVPALQYMSPLGFQLLNVACRECQRTTEDDSADHDTWIDGLCLYCQHAAAIARNAAATVPPALVVPDTEKEPQKSSQRAETWLCYACDCEYVDGEESCHNPRCAEGIGTVKAPSYECAECGASDHPTGQCPHTRQTAKQAALELAYDRSQAAAAIVRAVQRWREALAGMTSANPDDALNAVWEAGEAYESISNEAH